MFGDILDRLAEIFRPEAIAHFLGQSISDLTVAIATFAGFYLLWRLLRRGLRALLSRTKVDPTAAAFVQTALKVVLLTIGVVTALSQIGVDTASLLASLGVAGLTIGFAARDALSNMISGFFLFWDRPFVIGDLVEIDGKYGRVLSITLRSTRVVTPDGRMLAVPNSTALNAIVTSYTNFPHLRLDIDVTVGVGEDLGRARSLLLAIVDGDPRFMTDTPPAVVVAALNDYNVALQLQAWIHEERDHVPLRTELREKVFETLRGAGVDLPFQTFAVTPVDVRVQSAA